MSDSVIITSGGFPDPETLPLVSDVQFREPYSSAAINRKLRGITLPGIYSGFTPSAGDGLDLLISSGSDGGTCSFNAGSFYQLTARQQADVTIPMNAGQSFLVALQVTYALGTETYQVNSASSIQAVEFVLLDTSATLAENQLEMCKVAIPEGTTQITSAMIDLSGRVARSLTFELSSAIDSSEEEIAANSLAVKNAIAYIKAQISEAINTQSLNVTGATSLSSLLSVGGAVTMNSTLTVAGVSYFGDVVRSTQYLDLGYQNTAAGNRQISFYSNGNSTATAGIGVTGTSTTTTAMKLTAGTVSATGSLAVTGAASMGSTLTVSGAAAFAGNVTVGGTFKSTGEVQTTNVNGFRQVSNNYGLIHRFDGSNYYMLLTASGDQYGSWNSLRPIMVNASSGLVSIGNSLSVSGNLTVSGNMYTGSGASFVATDGNLYGSCWGGYLNNYIAGQVGGKTTLYGASNGYWRDLNTGLTIQWGYTAGSGAAYYWTSFPMVFPSACVSVVETVMRSGSKGADNWSSISGNPSTSGFTGGADGYGYYWMAIGW